MLWSSAPLGAHQTGLSTFVVHIKEEQRTVDTLLTLPSEDVAVHLELDQNEDETISGEELLAGWEEMGDYLDQHIVVRNDGRPCSAVDLRRSAVEKSRQNLWFLKAFRCDAPLGKVDLENTALLSSKGGYTHTAKIQLGDVVDIALFTPDSPLYGIQVSVQDPSPVTPTRTWAWFGMEGLRHLVFGPDHVLFLLCLLLAAPRPRTLVGIVTAFTVAHSMTLVASVLDWITMPVDIIEPLIAMSIAYAAWEASQSVRTESPAASTKRLWITTFVFGLIHGVGFSYLLREQLAISGADAAEALIAFNVGIEVGQLGLVALVFWPREKLRGRASERPFVYACCWLIGLIACFWLWERTLGG